jgi:chaperonin GroES
VIVRRIEEGEQVRGGIIIPIPQKRNRRKAKLSRGRRKVSRDGTRQTLDVKAGDRVCSASTAGSRLKLDGEELLIMREDEILGIIQRAAAGKKGK